jgi:nucleolar protein 9
MPKENKHSRGRRGEEKKRKRAEGDDEIPRTKRQKSQDPTESQGPAAPILESNVDVPMEDAEGEKTERPFYGMLEDEEQEYFRRADELLELNDFPSDEERSIFLANVYKEAEGKELKIACSQSCSRLMERLILLSTVQQKKKLFAEFAGNIAHLVQHRFASHCCEMLFIQSAPIVTAELTADSKKKGEEEKEEEISMESLFLQTLDELEGQMTFLLTDRFASHTLRVLLVILSGRPLEQSSTTSMLQSKKKEKISITGHDQSPTELTLNKRAVPSSFQFAVEKIISDTIATMDQSFIRILATHPTGNPSLQLLLELELTNPNSKKGSNADQPTIISVLLPDDITVDKSESQTFVNGLLYDPIGSRLLETIVTFAPGKLFKQIYRTVFKDRIAAIARNEISSYAAIKVLNRISKEDLEEAVSSIYPQIPGLIERHRTTVIKTFLERCQVRGVNTQKLINSISEAYGEKPETLILKMVCIDDANGFVTSTLAPPPAKEEDGEEVEGTKKKKHYQPPPKVSPTQLHGSLLAQSMLTIPGPPAKLIQNSLLALPSQTLLALSMYTTTSHIIQSALLPNNDIPFRRKLINALLFSGSSLDLLPTISLSLSSTGSHVLDALLTSTTAPSPNSTSAPLFSITERIANELSTHEHDLRNSWSGRIVWRNWDMDLFNRKRGDWVNKAKAAGAEASKKLTPAVPVANADNEDDDEVGKAQKKNKKQNKGKGAKDAKADPNAGKSAIQLAREKFAAAKIAKSAMKNNKGTGANARTVGV